MQREINCRQRLKEVLNIVGQAWNPAVASPRMPQKSFLTPGRRTSEGEPSVFVEEAVLGFYHRVAQWWRVEVSTGSLLSTGPRFLWWSLMRLRTNESLMKSS